VTVALFPDNTVLCNFAAVDRLDLLRTLLRERGRWTAAVAYEWSRSKNLLAPSREGELGDWLGEPVDVVDPAHIHRIEAIRRGVFGGVIDQPLKHLGEAQTCFVISEMTEYAGSWWLSDDQESVRYARFRGITTRETLDLLAEGVAFGELLAQDAFDLMRQMADQDRYMRMPTSPQDFLR
jgi:hypothetical protein